MDWTLDVFDDALENGFLVRPRVARRGRRLSLSLGSLSVMGLGLLGLGWQRRQDVAEGLLRGELGE